MNVSTILFIIVAILIVYMLYKKYQGDSDVAPAPNRSSAGAPRIEIEETVVELNPDTSNEEEGYMTEGYTEFLTGDDRKNLSGNIVVSLEWGNREGFGTVDELRFYRYVDTKPADKKSYANRDTTKTTLHPTKMEAFYLNNNGTETQVDPDMITYPNNGKYASIKKSQDANMFTSFKTGYKIKFRNKDKSDTNPYSVVGRTHMRIEYVIGTTPTTETKGHLVPETFEGTVVTDDNLDLTLSMTQTETRTIKPKYSGIQVDTDVTKESFYVIPGPFETTADNKKIKIGGRRDLGNIETSELFPKTGVLRAYTQDMNWTSSTKAYMSEQKDTNVFTNYWDHNFQDVYLDGFINDPVFEKRVQAQRGVMFRAAGATEEFNIIVTKTKFMPREDDVIRNWDRKFNENNQNLLNKYEHKDFGTPVKDEHMPSKTYHPNYMKSDNDNEGRVGLRRFHYKTTETDSDFYDLEEHWTPANDEGGDFYVKMDSDSNSTLGWKLQKTSTGASKFKLFKKDAKKLKISDTKEIDVNIYNIQLVETNVTGEDRKFLVTTNHTSSDSERNDNRIYAKAIDATLTEPEYKSIDWAFVNTKEVKIGDVEAPSGVKMIVKETKEGNTDKTNFSYTL